MGCWSESCAFSGMEISSGEPLYVMLMKPSRFGEYRWDITVPPIKGLYDDYGGASLTESNQQFELKSGDNWSVRDDKRGQPVYIAASVFEFLPKLKLEFGYVWKYDKSYKVKTIEDALSKKREYVKGIIDETVSRNKMTDESMRILGLFSLSDAFSVSENVVDCTKSYVEKEIINGCENFDEFLDFYFRAYTIKYAENELRKIIIPGAQGPQHNGDEALLQFYRQVIKLTRERIKIRESY